MHSLKNHYIFISKHQLGRNLKLVTLDWNKMFKDLHYCKVWKAALFWMHQAVKQIIAQIEKSALLKLLPFMLIFVAGSYCHTSRHLAFCGWTASNPSCLLPADKVPSKLLTWKMWYYFHRMYSPDEVFTSFANLCKAVTVFHYIITI